MARALLALLLLLPCLHLNASPNFPEPASLKPAVDFWIDVYTKVSTDQGYVHDDENLSVVYETLELPPYASREVRLRQENAAKQRVVNALSSLGRGKRTGLTSKEADVLAAWPSGTSSKTFAQAAHRVRFQLGQSDRFREGLIRSGQWKPHIRAVLAKHGLPPELEVLPHVESSFNPAAYSKVAAAGMWQFMPATAREYMRVDHIVDERMDPFISTEGAARLLKTNYKITGTWPLALTSYNHGAGGVMRAAKAVGTKDIGEIAKRYKGPSFGFASRNFYASFLAALEVDSNPGRYMSRLQLDAPISYDVVTVQDYVSANALARGAGISLEELKAHNPALREPVWTGEKYIPRGYAVRVPSSKLQRPLQNTVASLSGDARLGYQKPDRTHRIAPGDSLSGIARRYGTSVSKLMALNGLRNHSIRTGKTLILPGTVQNGSLTAEHVANTRARLAAGQSQKSGTPQHYVIRSGDSLWSIARRFKVSTEQLQAWNDISGKSPIRPGQKLIVSYAG
jgi:membrane-bound lytic murein transglycosylase D